MKTITTLFLIILSLHSIAQEVTGHGNNEIQVFRCPTPGPVYIIDDFPLVPAKKVDCVMKGYFIGRPDPFDYTFTRAELKKLPITDLRDALCLLPGMYQSRRGDDVNVFGARINSVNYIIDGVPLPR